MIASVHPSSLLLPVLLLLLSRLPAASSIATDFRDSPLLGDFATVSDMKPRVVLDYLSTCATDIDTTPIISSTDDPPSCFVTVFMQRMFPQDTWGSECVLQEPIVYDTILQALDYCGTTTTSYDAEKETLYSLLTHQACATQLCDAVDDGIAFYEIESNWMESCAGLDLPTPIGATDGWFYVPADDDQILLSCMIHFAMSTPSSNFGLTDPLEGSEKVCYPPGFENMATFCPNELARVALEECSSSVAAAALGGNFRNLDSSFGTVLNSTSRSFIDHHRHAEATLEDEYVMAKFCSFMVDLSSDPILPCLLPLCDYERETTTAPTWPRGSTTGAPSFMPTLSPTTMPSFIPTISPTTMPSMGPTGSPSSLPSALPSSQPTKKPSAGPTKEPSLRPSALPSQPPSGLPSTLPSIFPSNMPSETPTAKPSVGPSVVPSMNPTTLTPDIVEVQFLTSLSLQNVTEANVSNENEEAFVAALKEAIFKALGPIDGNVAVEVVSLVDSLPSNNTLEAELKVDIRRECHMDDCSDGSFSDGMLEDFRDALDKAIQSGALTNAIQQAGQQNGIETLETAWVATGQAPFVRFSVRVRESGNQKDDTPDVASIGTSTGGSSITTAIVLVSLLFAI